eukprot:g3022.t1
MDRKDFVPKTVNPTFQLDSKLQSIQEFMIQQEVKLGSGEDMKVLRDIKDQSFRVFLQNVRQIENAAFELNKKEAAAMQQAKSLLGQMGPLIQTDVPIQSNSTSTGALK